MQVTNLKCYITKCTKLAWGENIEVAPVHDIKTYRALLILDLSTRWRRVVNFRPQPLYLQHPLNGRLSNARGSPDTLKKVKILCPCQESNPGWSNSHYTDCPIPTPTDNTYSIRKLKFIMTEQKIKLSSKIQKRNDYFDSAAFKC
jgi:hypothetical protein